jgi:outer membrane protein
LKKLKKFLLVYLGINILFIVIGTTTLAQEEISKYSMNLQEFIEKALESNHDLKSKKYEIQLKEKDLDIAKGERLGKLDLNMSYKNYDNKVAVGDAINENHVKDNEKYSGVISMEIPLYKGGSLRMNQKSAFEALESQKLNFSWEEDKLIYDVAETYYQILELEKLIKTNNEHLDELVEQKRIVDEYILVGKAIKIDGIKEEVEILTTQQDIEFIKSNLRSSYLLIFHLAGIPAESTITVTEIDEEKFEDYNLKNILAKALINRKDYLSLKKEKSEMEYMIEVSKGIMKPEVDFIANYNLEGDGDLETYDNWNVGVQFKYYLFQGGTALSKVKKAHIDEDIVEEKIKELKSRISLEVRGAYFDMTAALVNIKRAEKSVSYAKENLRIEKIKYEAEKNRVAL